MEKDICMTVRLQIAYGRLSIRSVRNAFEYSVGSRLKKFGGADNAEFLQRDPSQFFISQFKDEYKLPRMKYLLCSYLGSTHSYLFNLLLETAAEYHPYTADGRDLDNQGLRGYIPKDISKLHYL